MLHAVGDVEGVGAVTIAENLTGHVVVEEPYQCGELAWAAYRS